MRSTPEGSRIARRTRAFLVAGVTALGFAGTFPALAVSMGSAPATATAGDIAVAEGFARAMPAGASNGAGFLTITNRGTAPDRLTALSSPSSGEVDIHQTSTDGRTMRMRPLPGTLEIAPGQTVRLQPRGSLHLMFVGVTAPFAEGSEVTVTLTFERAGKVALKLPVLSPAVGEAPGGQGLMSD